MKIFIQCGGCIKNWGNFSGGGWEQIFSHQRQLPQPPTPSREDPAHNMYIRKFDTILY